MLTIKQSEERRLKVETMPDENGEMALWIDRYQDGRFANRLKVTVDAEQAQDLIQATEAYLDALTRAQP